MKKKKLEAGGDDTYQIRIGRALERVRIERGWTQAELAAKAKTSQSAIHRIEKGQQNVSLDMIKRLSDILGRQILSVADEVSQSYVIHGGKELHGSITVNTSKNAAVGLLCASLLNDGKTVLKGLAKIEEVYRIIEVLESIGVRISWVNDGKDLEIISPKELRLDKMNVEAARRTRSILMFMGPLLHKFDGFELPYAGGCSLGTRTIEPHLKALSEFGVKVDARGKSGFYKVSVDREGLVSTGADGVFEEKKIVLIERGDTVTENALMAAAKYPGVTRIVGASPNYMVQDLCFFLEKLGVKIEGIGTTTLIVTGVARIDEDVEYCPSEDPIEAMSLIAAGIVTKSEIEILRAPIEFLEVELEVLKDMGAVISRSEEYKSRNGRTRLVDLKLKKARLKAPADKIHPMPFPGLNIDNLPFFSVIAATAKGRTLIHDWVFENRAIYITELANLNVKVELLDAHRVYITGETNFRPAEMMAPPALRPAVVILLAMLAAPGTSILRNVYMIKRGYQDFSARLKTLGADIEAL
ncbi:UDP-N-acetylglucosamine 1-carboxyvinyltransferase [Candidatus Saccharibacteria bacterium]|nr:UDP-N-acetylglucosamine 1-carboxyvinyltransferase [Candidatus Saccharibacteria bacterium]